MALDILIPLGDGSVWGNNNELRYCLRSIERYATGYDRIFIVGEDPGFLNGDGKVRFCPLPEIDANKEARIASKILRGFQETDIADDAVMFNDDYVLTAPIDLRTLPFYHRGELSLGIPSQGSVLYRAALGDTVRALRQAGRPTLHYDVHMPMILNRHKFIGLNDWWIRSEKAWQGFVCKSIYANNLDGIISELIVDCKLQFGHFPWDILDGIARDRWVFSYADGALTDSLKHWLADRFPERSGSETAEKVDLGLTRMIAKQAIYRDAKGNIVERTNNPMQHCFLLVPKGAVIPPHVIEKLKKKEAAESAAAKPDPPQPEPDATKAIENRQKRIVRPTRKRSQMVEAIE